MRSVPVSSPQLMSDLRITAILQRHGMCGGCCLHQLRRFIWDCQIQHRRPGFRCNSTGSCESESVSRVRPDQLTLNVSCSTDLLPCIFSGILAIYGLVSAVLISNHIRIGLSLYTAMINLGSGLAVGLCGLAAGFSLGIAGDAGTRSVAQQPRLFVSMILILIFSEVLRE